MSTKLGASVTQQHCGHTGPSSHTRGRVPGNDLQGPELDKRTLFLRDTCVKSPCVCVVLTAAGGIPAKDWDQAKSMGRGVLLAILACLPDGMACTHQNEGRGMMGSVSKTDFLKPD